MELPVRIFGEVAPVSDHPQSLARISLCSIRATSTVLTPGDWSPPHHSPRDIANSPVAASASPIHSPARFGTGRLIRRAGGLDDPMSGLHWRPPQVGGQLLNLNKF